MKERTYAELNPSTSVTFEGIEVRIIDQPEIGGGGPLGAPYYLAIGLDKNNVKYFVTWDILDDIDINDEDIEAENHCDWENPSDIYLYDPHQS